MSTTPGPEPLPHLAPARVPTDGRVRRRAGWPTRAVLLAAVALLAGALALRLAPGGGEASDAAVAGFVLLCAVGAAVAASLRRPRAPRTPWAEALDSGVLFVGLGLLQIAQALDARGVSPWVVGPMTAAVVLAMVALVWWQVSTARTRR